MEKKISVRTVSTEPERMAEMADKQPWVLRKPGQRGQLTIPREWRLQLGWDDETQVIVSLDADHHQLMINEANSVVTAGLQAIPPTANRKDRQ